jgi:hypothetical protein
VVSARKAAGAALRHAEDRPAAYTPGGQLQPLALPAGFYTADVTYVLLWPDGLVVQDFTGPVPG